MPMRETEVGCFIRFYNKMIRELNLLNPDGTGFNVVLSPAYPYVTKAGEPTYSGYQMPGNDIVKVTPPEITIHTSRRLLPNNRYQNNFIRDIYGEEGDDHEGALVGKVYSQEVDITLQATIWAEDPRQREFLKMQIEKPFINRRKMYKTLFEIGMNNGWDNGFVVQNMYMNHRGDIDVVGDGIMNDTVQGDVSDGAFVPKIYTGAYEINFTTEIRDIENFYGNTIFDVDQLEDTGLNPSDYDIATSEGMTQLIIDLMNYYGITINPNDELGQPKSLSDITTESAVAYGNAQGIHVDSLNFTESLQKISIGPIGVSRMDLYNADGSQVGELEEPL